MGAAGAEAAAVVELWRGEGGAKVRCRLRAASAGWERAEEPCGIMHESPATVELEGLPNAWRQLRGRGLNAVRLDCGHGFHAHALAMHFFLGSMRCPICRAGHDERLDARMLPRGVRKAYAARRERAELAAEELQLQAAMDVFEDDFSDDHLEMLALTASFASGDELLSSPLVRAGDAGAGVEFRVQRCWRRQVNASIKRAVQLDGRARGRVALHHPMLREPVQSAELCWRGVQRACEAGAAAYEIPMYCGGEHGAAPAAAPLAWLALNPVACTAELTVDAARLHHICVSNLVAQLRGSVQGSDELY